MTPNHSAASSARSRPRSQRTETIRPFVQKYQYLQLPLPEPGPVQEDDLEDVEFPVELVKTEPGE